MPLCDSDPEVAVTVTIAVTGDVPVDVPVDPFDDPPPHPAKNPSPIAASASTSHRRFLPQPTQQNNAASTDPGTRGNSDGRITFAAPEFVTVSAVVTAALLEGVTVAGLKPQVVFAGKPAHANETCPVNPFTGLTVTVTAGPLPSDGTETVVGLTLSEKSAGGLIV